MAVTDVSVSLRLVVLDVLEVTSFLEVASSQAPLTVGLEVVAALPEDLMALGLCDFIDPETASVAFGLEVDVDIVGLEVVVEFEEVISFWGEPKVTPVSIGVVVTALLEASTSASNSPRNPPKAEVVVDEERLEMSELVFDNVAVEA